jgi:hypothetical protein
MAPDGGADSIQDVPTVGAESRGIGKVIGSVAGAASGIALAGTLIPGVGLIAIGGILATALFGGAGAAVGARIAGALEESLSEGVARDELFLYEDALRQGRTVLVVMAEDDAQAKLVREALTVAGAESIDSARKRWWIGLRDAERERYGESFERDEAEFRSGFVAALSRELRGRPYEQAQSDLAWRYPEIYQHEAFRAGYERGQAYQAGWTETSAT